MKYNVPICWKTVEVEWTSVEVEADSEEDAKNIVEDMYLDSLPAFSGKSEIVDGYYEFGEITPVSPLDKP